MRMRAGEPGSTKRTVRVLLDGEDVSNDCWQFDSEEGWVDLFERDPADPKKRKKVRINGKEQAASVRKYGKVEYTCTVYQRQDLTQPWITL